MIIANATGPRPTVTPTGARSQSPFYGFEPPELRPFYAPDSGATDGGGGGTNASGNANGAGAQDATPPEDAGALSAKQKEDANSNANPNGDPKDEKNKVEGADPNAPKTFTLTEKELTDRIAQGIARDRADAERKAKREQTTQEANKAKEAGDFKALSETQATRITDLERELEEERTARKLSETNALRAKVASRNKLPDNIATRLVGETEAELEADAKQLAKLMAPPPPPKKEAAPPTENGGGRAGANGQEAKAPDKKPEDYPFNKPGSVSW